jgi:hypothetical protein
MPDWINDDAERIKREKAASDARAQAAIDASFKIAKDGPSFWQQLLASLKENTNDLPKINLAGNTSSIKAPEKGEQHCRVDISKPGATFPVSTYTDLFYTLGNTAIRAHTQV